MRTAPTRISAVRLPHAHTHTHTCSSPRHPVTAVCVCVCLCRVRDEAVPELPYRGRAGVAGGGVALAGQPPLQGVGTRVRGVGAEQPLAADGRSLRAGQRTQQVGAAEKHVVLLSWLS